MDIRHINTLSGLPWGTATNSPKTMGSQKRMTFLYMLHCAADTLCYFWVCTPVSTCVNGCAWLSTVRRCVHVSEYNYGVEECCFPRLISRAKQQLLLTTDYNLSCRRFTQKTNRGQEGIRVETQKLLISLAVMWRADVPGNDLRGNGNCQERSPLMSVLYKEGKKIKEIWKIIPKRLRCGSQYQILTQYEAGTETAGRISTMTSIS